MVAPEIERHRTADPPRRSGDQRNRAAARTLHSGANRTTAHAGVAIHGQTFSPARTARTAAHAGFPVPRHAYFTGFGAALPAWSMGVICRKSMLTCAGRVATKVITSATSSAVSDSTPS
ncbi:hypothetical protein CHAN_00405 [Corynebacterium hansenii]|nr:hypothetical protein CHAN_00405 [Corynebacterium hansenii]